MKLQNLLLACATFFLVGFSSCGNNEDKPVTDTLAGKDSLTSINELIRKDPGNLDLYLRRANISMQQKAYGPAMMDVDRILAIDSNKAEYLIAAADIYFFTGKVSRTKQLLERAVKVNPENVNALLRLAQLQHYLTNYDEEIVLLDKALQLDVRNAQAYFMKGMLFKDKGDTAKAISSMQTAVEQDPDHYNAYIQLGVLCAAQKNPLAESYYLNALKINANSEEAMYNLGMFYQETKNYNAALETYTTLLKVNPNHFDANFNLGMLHTVSLNLVDEGMKYFNAAITLEPNNPRGYYGRGFCFEKKANVINARADYQKALQLDPDYAIAAYALNRLDK